VAGFYPYGTIFHWLLFAQVIQQRETIQVRTDSETRFEISYAAPTELHISSVCVLARCRPYGTVFHWSVFLHCMGQGETTRLNAQTQVFLRATPRNAVSAFKTNRMVFQAKE
jgi:hypothetical protein